MAKTAKLKHDPASNPRSRASKRATSPSINVDKSLKDAPRASDATPVLAPTRNAGISKSKKSKKQMTRAQRARQERTLARAEAVQDQMERKVDVSQSRQKKRQVRKGQWDDINVATNEEKRKAMKTLDIERANDDELEDESDAENGGDAEMKLVDEVPPVSAPTTDITTASRLASPPGAGLDEEIDKIT